MPLDRAPPGLRMRTVPSPLGRLTLTGTGVALVALDWALDCAVDSAHRDPASADTAGAGIDDRLLTEAARQLSAYFAGDLRRFDLPLAPRGTAYQQRVWDALGNLPYGAAVSYGDLATALGSGPRAVAQACARNPLPVILPCHRIVGRGNGRRGALGGYSGAGGVATKRWLLRHEGFAAA